MKDADRIPCRVVGCRRTAKRSPEDVDKNVHIICYKCWRLSSKASRKRILRVERFMRKIGVTGWHDSKPGTPGRHGVILHNKLFEKIVAEATEAQVGLR